jgi:divalent metal cation (Fe/Co/Zn/Cd) transporter
MAPAPIAAVMPNHWSKMRGVDRLLFAVRYRPPENELYMKPEPENVERPQLVQRALMLEWLTVGWNVVEGVVAVLAAVGAGSVALLGFGIDSFVESASGLVLIWRLRAERGADPERVERVERRAQRLVAASLFGLAIYLLADASRHLLARQRPEVSRVGIAITILSLGVMWRLAGAKREMAQALGSGALDADAFQTEACFWLSVITLSGLTLHALFGWWWADPVAALGLTPFVVREGRGAWRGEECNTSC